MDLNQALNGTSKKGLKSEYYLLRNSLKKVFGGGGTGLKSSPSGKEGGTIGGIGGEFGGIATEGAGARES